MENLNSKNTNTQKPVDESKRYIFKKKLISIFIIIFTMLTTVISLLLTYYNQKQVQKRENVTTANYKINKLELQNLQEALTLDMPVLYSALTWIQVPVDIEDDNLKGIWINDKDIIKITEGKIYSTEFFGTNPSSLLNYYIDYFQANNWNVNNSFLQFNDFTLRPLAGDSPCGGITGFLGYKNEKVKIVNIKYDLKDCGTSIEEVGKSNEGILVIKVFISNALSINKIKLNVNQLNP